MKNITLRQYQESDAQALADIYYDTIHNVNSKDYTNEQIHAWAPSSCLQETQWMKKWGKCLPIVAQLDSKIVGFAEFEDTGHIDCFYVHHKHQGQGIGSALMHEITHKVAEKRLTKLYAEVSITAKSFFEKYGFSVLSKQTVILRGISLTNYKMAKVLRCK